jgi:tRNA(Ile)-lysidine synthase
MHAADDVRRATGADVTAEGHTLDDHVETVLLNLFRGAGLEGLSGIWPGDRSSALVQPLLDVERGEVEAFCRALHLRPRRDPTNEDRRHLRNVIRLDVLPAIEHATGRDVRGPIARSAGLLSADRDELRSAALEAMRRVVRRSAEGIGFDVQALRSLPGPVAARAIRLALFDVSTPDDPPWTRDAIEAILDLAHGRPGRRRDLPAGLKARRDREYVLLSRTSPESRV